MIENERLAHLSRKAEDSMPFAGSERFTDDELKEMKIAIGKRLVEAFGTENYSEIAQRLKTTPAIARLYAIGDRFPAPEMLIQFRRVTGISTDWLLTGEGVKYQKMENVFSPEEENEIRRLARENGRSFSEQVALLASAGLKFLEKLNSWKDRKI